MMLTDILARPSPDQSSARLDPAPAISVVIPTCDRPHYLGEAVASVLAQSLPPMEILVVDNGRAPVSMETLPAGVTLHRIAPRVGPSRARNFGTAMARGSHVAFLDDDDWWHSDFLQEAWRTMATDDVRCAYGQLHGVLDGRIFSRQCASPDTLTIRTLLRRNPGTSGQNLLIERRFFLALGGFDERLRLPEDRALALEVLLAGERIGISPGSIAFIRHHASDRLTNRQLPKLAFVWKYRQLYPAAMLTYVVGRILALALLSPIVTRVKAYQQGRASCVSQ